MGEFYDAISDLQKVISIVPENTYAYILLAQSQLAVGDKPGAINSLQEASNRGSKKASELLKRLE